MSAGDYPPSYFSALSLFDLTESFCLFPVSIGGIGGPDYPNRHTNNQVANAIDHFLLDSKLPFIQYDKPKLAYISTSGPYYVKEGPGSQYIPGRDTLVNVGASPKSTAAQAMALVALGMSGVKGYHYEHPYQSKGKASDDNIGDAYQTGASVSNDIDDDVPTKL